MTGQTKVMYQPVTEVRSVVTVVVLHSISLDLVVEISKNLRSIPRHTTRGKIFNGEESSRDRSASELKLPQINIDEQYQAYEESTVSLTGFLPQAR